MTTTYKIIVDGNEVATMEADFAQASCPLTIDGHATPFQVADAKHRPTEAAEILLKWMHSEGGCPIEVDDDGDLIYGSLKVV